jgi:hypothetical protein
MSFTGSHLTFSDELEKSHQREGNQLSVKTSKLMVMNEKRDPSTWLRWKLFLFSTLLDFKNSSLARRL